MKFILMLLALFMLTDPVMAKPVNNTSECLNIYRTYINEYGASRLIPDAQMLDFIGRCLPDDALNNPMNNATNSATNNDISQPQSMWHGTEQTKTLTIKI